MARVPTRFSENLDYEFPNVCISAFLAFVSFYYFYWGAAQPWALPTWHGSTCHTTQRSWGKGLVELLLRQLPCWICEWARITSVIYGPVLSQVTCDIITWGPSFEHSWGPAFLTPSTYPLKIRPLWWVSHGAIQNWRAHFFSLLLSVSKYQPWCERVQLHKSQQGPPKMLESLCII